MTTISSNSLVLGTASQSGASDFFNKRMILLKENKDFSWIVFDIETSGLFKGGKNENIRLLAFGAKDHKEREYYYSLNDFKSEPNDHLREQKLLKTLIKVIFGGNYDIVAGYNIFSFDLSVINFLLNRHGIDNRFFSFSKKEYVVNGTELTIFGGKPYMSYCAYPNYRGKYDKKVIYGFLDLFLLVLRYDSVNKVLGSYSLKEAARVLCGRGNRVLLDNEEMAGFTDLFHNNFSLFMDYLRDDINDTFMLFKKLSKNTVYTSLILEGKFDSYSCFKGIGSKWDSLLESYYGKDYTSNLEPDEKISYIGATTGACPGIFRNVWKIDVSSLYPSIMLNYGVRSRKDTDNVMLFMLRELTRLRLEAKKHAKNGNVLANEFQSAFKTVINSAYGFLGATNLKFNDMEQASFVTTKGREVLDRLLTNMMESNLCLPLEWDTDGIIFGYSGQEENIMGLITRDLPFDMGIEVEFKDKYIYIDSMKNYIIFNEDQSIYLTKGVKFSRRGAPKITTDCFVELVRRFIFGGPFKEYCEEISERITSGNGWDIVSEVKRIGENEKRLLEQARSCKDPNIVPGVKVTCAFADRKKALYSFSKETGYDIAYYLNVWNSQFCDLISEEL